MPHINFYPTIKVWFLPAGSSVEESAKHDPEGEGAAVNWKATELLAEYEQRGDEVIQMRYLRSPVDAGDVLYQSSSHIDD